MTMMIGELSIVALIAWASRWASVVGMAISVKRTE